MSEAKFTPGPWRTLAGDWDKDCDGFCRYTISPLKELNASDAHLIAAAPELYEALKACLPHITANGEKYCRAKAEAALAKAEGRQ